MSPQDTVAHTKKIKAKGCRFCFKNRFGVQILTVVLRAPESLWPLFYVPRLGLLEEAHAGLMRPHGTRDSLVWHESLKCVYALISAIARPTYDDQIRPLVLTGHAG